MFANIATTCPKEIEVFGKGSASAKLTLRNNPFSKGFSSIDNIKLPYEYCPYWTALFNCRIICYNRLITEQLS